VGSGNHNWFLLGKVFAAIDKACRKTVGIYPAYFDFDFERPDPGLFEIKIRRCFFRDFFDRHDARLVTTVMCAFRRELH
jgi:hypothetical protein